MRIPLTIRFPIFSAIFLLLPMFIPTINALIPNLLACLHVFEAFRNRSWRSPLLTSSCLALVLACCLSPTLAKSEIRVEAELVEKSGTPSKQDRGVYLEGLVNYLWEVQEVHQGDLEPGDRILVSHYGVFDDEEQPVTKHEKGDHLKLRLLPFDSVAEVQEIYFSDNWELDFELPRFHQTNQELKRQAVSNKRFDYGASDYSQVLPTLVGLRNQLKVISIGDSQVAEGISAPAFRPVESSFLPVAYNAGLGSQRLNWIDLVVNDYAAEMPELETIVLGINPRMFSEKKADHETHPVKASHGYAADMELAKEGWPIPRERLRYNLKEGYLPNRFKAGRVPGLANASPASLQKDGAEIAKKRLKRKYHGREQFPKNWEMSERSREMFENIVETAEKEGIHVLAFSPLINPAVKQFPRIIDEDHTTVEGYQELMAYMEDLEKRYRNFQFEDVNQMGNHFLSADHFRDTDHLVNLGALKLTAYLNSLMPPRSKLRLKTEMNGATLTATSNEPSTRWLLSDGTILDGDSIEHQFEHPGRYVVAAVAGNDQRASSEDWTIVEVPNTEDTEEVGRFADQAKAVIRYHQDAPRMLFADGTASDDMEVVIWDFGDGHVALGPFVFHEYDKPGRYEVTMTAFCKNGTTDTAKETVRIQ